MIDKNKKYPHTWEEAIGILRKNPDHKQLIYDAYLTEDLTENAERFAKSDEFNSVLSIISEFNRQTKDVLDIAAGNGIATYAFAKCGFNVTSVEPDPSFSLGRNAIKIICEKNSLKVSIIEAYGENLPFSDSSMDIVYIRQGLHHAMDLKKMVSECFRVLKVGGLLIACREHVVNNHRNSLKRFLDSQVDHQLYGGENAFTLKEYISSIRTVGFKLVKIFGPLDSPINLHPVNLEFYTEKILNSKPGKVLSLILPMSLVKIIGLFFVRLKRDHGRLYSFVGIKENC